MSFTIQLTGFTSGSIGASILNVDLYACTGSLVQCTGGTINDLTNYSQLAGHTNISKREINGRYVVVPDGIKTIKLVPSNANDGVCRRVTEVFPLKFKPYLGGFIGNMHTQIYYVSSSYSNCDGCS